jgi:tetratricopeptide (TPR) repeat protein
VAVAAVVVGLGCRGQPSPPSPCPDLTRELDAPAAGARALAHRVDDAIAAARSCPDLDGAARGPGIGRELARARILDAHPEAALAELTSLLHPAVAIRRAELLDRLGRPGDAVGAIAPALLLDADAQLAQTLYAISNAVRSRSPGEAARRIATAALPDRPRLAHRAAADCPEAGLSELAALGPELATAVADRIEHDRGPAAARGAREQAVALEPDDADAWDALGRARIAAGATDDALAAWDRASTIAPGQPTFRVAPIRALVIAGNTARARARANDLAADARKRADVELLVTASAGAAAAADGALAIELAREARRNRPGDGRLAFLLGQRLAEGGDARAAADAYAELLTCGAHGRAWHRHEVAGRLLALGAAAIVNAALAAPRACVVVEPEDLATYVDTLRAKAP